MPGNILIIDDEEQLRKLLTRIISLEGFNVSQSGDLKSAQALLDRQPIDIIICDVRLPDGNGVAFVKTVKEIFPPVEIILLTAFGNITDGVQAIKNGAFDYIVKGDDNDRIIPLLFQAMEGVLTRRQRSVSIKAKSSADFTAVIGESQLIKNAIKLAQKISESDSTVLLLGETGTGKEVFANAIHQNSKRNKAAIVAINCSAFNKELLEGELFGHKAGAFTGAVKDKKGLVEIADGGTLFLDEIGELNIELQAKLLRFLENGQFIKLGDTKVSKANVRIIAATNRQLQKEVDEGNFREDLYYRLNVIAIELPPLRYRKEDIPQLADYFLKSSVAKENKPSMKLDKVSIDLLSAYTWRGNIRELKNVIERAVILADGDLIMPEHLPYDIQKQNSTTPRGLSLTAVEKEHIGKVLHYTKGNKAKAARILEIGLATLYRKMEEYQLSPGNSK